MGLTFHPIDDVKRGPSWARASTAGFEYGFTTRLNFENVEQFGDVILWCRERFGDCGAKSAWYFHDVTLWFRETDHAMEFKLRWL